MTFNFDHIKEDLRRRLKEYMEIEGVTFNRQNKCKCILSGHNDSDKKPNMSYDKKAYKVKCFKCNNAPMDIFEVIRELKGYTDFKDQFAEACRVLNVQNPYDDKSYTATNKPRTQKTPQKPIELSKEINNTKKKFEEQDHEEKAKINAYIEKARGNIEDKDCLAYLESRGLYNIDILKKYCIGYSIKTLEDKPFSSIITPNSIDPELFSFTGLTRRQLNAGITKEGQIIEKGKNGALGIFNLKALYQSEKPVFITEGEFNAFSILEITGGEIEGVSIGSTSNTQTLIDILKQRRPEAFIFLELDDDYKMQSDDSIKGNRGKEEQAKIEEYLKQANISFLSVNTVKACKMPDKEDNTKLIQCKDQSDALTYDRETFANEIDNILIQFKSIQEEQGEKQMTKNEPIKEQITAPEPVQEDKNKIDYEGNKKAYFKKFIDDIEKFDPENNINTRFDRFNNEVGITSGLLYGIGGVSSYGKTTFALQIADDIASYGKDSKDVLFFSLEMSRSELIARSLSRLSFIFKGSEDKGVNVKNMSNVYKQATGNDFDKFDKAYGYYEQNILKNLYIEEGDFETTIKNIRDTIENYIKSTGKRPVVFVDYLQIITPETGKNERQDVTASVKTLKILARIYDIPVFFISSFSRAYYYKCADIDAFKESGNIEYSCDVVLALQKRGMFKSRNEDKNSSNNKNYDDDNNNPVRDIEILVLKNRWGKRYFTIDYDYIPEFHHFKEKKPNQKQHTKQDYDKE